MDEFEIPEDVRSLDDAALRDAIEAAIEASAVFADADPTDLTDEQIDRVEALASFVTSAREVDAERETARTERAQRVAAARTTLSSAPAGEGEGEGEDEQEKEKEREAVQASARRASAARAARKAPKAETPEGDQPRASIIAAADVPGFAAGQALDDLSVAGEAVMSRLKAMPLGGRSSRRDRYGAAVIRKGQGTSGAFSQNDFRTDTELLYAASSETRLANGSLVAAGGWGAPSETLLDFCSIESADGLVDIPEVTLTRPGLTYTKGPSFEDIFDSATGFIDQTEAQAEAGQVKTSLRPEVPDFVDARLEAVGVMVEAGLLLRAGWPALVQRYIDAALIAHQHKVSAKVISKIEGYTGAAIDLTGGFGNALDILAMLELVAEGERQRFRMADGATLEVILPRWLRAFIRADLANRTGVDLTNVTDAQIDAHFSNRNLRVQWVYNYQGLEVDETAGIVTGYPSRIEVLMYPAGTYVKGTSDVITLDTVYDSVNLKNNDYVALFVEEGILVANPCNEGRRLGLPIAATGRTGAADITANLFATGDVAP